MRRVRRWLLVVVLLIVLAPAFAWFWAEMVPDTITDANFARLRTGMSLTQVREILGQETTYYADGVDLQPWWEGRSRTIKLEFAPDGTVIPKEIVYENAVVRSLGRLYDDVCGHLSNLAGAFVGAPPPTPIP